MTEQTKPRKPESRQRTDAALVRMTPDEGRILREAAQSRNMPLGRLLRELTLQAVS